MSYPVKPWEVSLPIGGAPINYVSNTDRLHSSAIPFPGTGGGSAQSTDAPLVPPRPSQTRPIYSAYNRGSMMHYPNYGYGCTTPYFPMGNVYGGGNFFGNRPYFEAGGGSEPTFSQLAEESSASAFQSIESFVSAFGSISMMLESTFHALYSSFRAVVGVADHLGRVKQVFSALAIFRFFKWVWRRILYLIGISKIKPETVESLWKEAADRFPGVTDGPQAMLLREDPSKPSSWPILMFLGFIFAGPYLMWKLVKSLNLDGSQPHRNREWATGESEHFIAEVKFHFNAATDQELNLKSGQTIRLAPAKFQPSNVRGWALASDGSKIGLVPLNYIKVLGKRTGSGNGNNLAFNNVYQSMTPPTSNTAQPVSDNNYQHARPRVRFDLNPRPAATDTLSVENPISCKSEPAGILVRNENSMTGGTKSAESTECTD